MGRITVMAKPTDKTPQEIKRAKQRAQFQEATGITFPEGDVFGQMMAAKLNDALRIGAHTINPDEEDSPIHCSHEWHFARYCGPGSTLAPLLYGISLHLTKDSGNFKMAAESIARYLNKKKPDEVYAAASLLVADGFWQVIEQPDG